MTTWNELLTNLRNTLLGEELISVLSGKPLSTKPRDLGYLIRTLVSKKPICAKQIEQLAYFKWEAAGCPPDNSDRFWIEAEQELRNSQMSESK